MTPFCSAVQGDASLGMLCFISLLLVAASARSLPTFRSPTRSVPGLSFSRPLSPSQSRSAIVRHARTDSPSVSLSLSLPVTFSFFLSSPLDRKCFFAARPHSGFDRVFSREFARISYLKKQSSHELLIVLNLPWPCSDEILGFLRGFRECICA